MVDKIIAYVLWFFLGFFGIHRMWYQKWVSGFIQLSLMFLPLAFLFFGVAGFTISAIFQSPMGLISSGGSIAISMLMIIASGIWWCLDAILILFWKRETDY